MDNIEKSRPPQTESSILDEEDFQNFVESRQINSEDIELLESLSRSPKTLFIEFHNFFSLSKDRSAQLLESQLNALDPEESERKEFLELLRDFLGKYDWATCWNMIRVFERRKNKK